MGSRVFIDITGDTGGRVYVIDADHKLRETFNFALGEGMAFTLEGSIPEDMDQSTVSVPASWLDFRALELDLPDAGAARAVLPFELDGLLVNEPSHYVIDALVAPARAQSPAASPGNGEPGNGAGHLNGKAGKVLALYMPAARVGELVSGLSDIGIDPRYITCLELASKMDDILAGDYSSLLGGHEGAEGTEGRQSPDELDEPRRVDLAQGQFDSPAINLRLGEFSFKGDVRRGLRKIRLTFALFAALMVVLALTSTINAIFDTRQAAALEQKVLGIYGEIFPGQKPANARGLSYKVRSKLKEYRQKSEAMGSLDVLSTMKQIQGAMPGGLKFTDLTLSREGVVLKGEAGSLESIEQARTSMEAFLFDVKITQTGKAVSGQTDFNITARMVEPDRKARK